MIQPLLIANRRANACRIIRTAKKLGLTLAATLEAPIAERPAFGVFRM